MFAAYITGIAIPIAMNESKSQCYEQALDMMVASVNCPKHGELACKILNSEMGGDDAKLLEIKLFVVS